MAKSEIAGLVRRHEGNPILTAGDIPFSCNTVFNGCAVRYGEGYAILLRVEGQQGYSIFALGTGENGFHFEIEDSPVMVPSEDGPFATFERHGVEDPRVTAVDGTYYVIYTAFGDYGPAMAIARTEDFHAFQRLGIISEPGNKDGVLFPEKVAGRFVRFDRPIADDVGRIWVSYSEDLLNWGDAEAVIGPRDGYWDSYRIGASAQPIRTDEGWLEIYHGTQMTASGPIYRAGVLLLDLEDPARVLGRSRVPVLSPSEPYERIGDINNVVFVSGAVAEPDGSVKIYYGAADTYICAAEARVDELVALALNHGPS